MQVSRTISPTSLLSYQGNTPKLNRLFYMHPLHHEITRVLDTIFDGHPYSVTITKGKRQPEVTVSYQDFLTPRTLSGLLSLVPELNVEWDIERTMSDTLRHQLLDELYEHPERLTSHCYCRFNVRFYVFDRFATTDFTNSKT